jgi:hypothetical protein
VDRCFGRSIADQGQLLGGAAGTARRRLPRGVREEETTMVLAVGGVGGKATDVAGR